MFDDLTKNPDSPFFGAEVMSTYGRAQAIEDGFLVDVTPQGKRVGFDGPTCVTREVWSRLDTDHLVWTNERVRRILNTALAALDPNQLDGTTDAYFDVTTDVTTDVGSFRLRATVDGDGLTIGFPGDF